MKTYLLVAAAAAAIAAQPALATTTIEGASQIVAVHGSDPGLAIKATPLTFGPITLDLNPFTFFTPSSAIANILTIGTDEDVINRGEDTIAYDLTIGFSFSDPMGVTGGPITGSTVGKFIIPALQLGGYGSVTWDGPAIFNFGNGGQFKLTLFDDTFSAPGTATVQGRFELLSESRGAVPEPTTWGLMLAGFGVLGFAMRRRTVAVSFS